MDVFIIRYCNLISTVVKDIWLRQDKAEKIVFDSKLPEEGE
jgi:hypothetical protein